MVPVLSNRLKACCQFVRPGDRVADVGCDHGYLGIYLLLSGVARSVIAADVNTGHDNRVSADPHIISDGHADAVLVK